MSHVPIIERTAKGGEIPHRLDLTARTSQRQRDVIDLVGKMFDSWADRGGHAGAFSALISVVVERAIRRQIAGPIAQVLRRNAEILEAAQLAKYRRNTSLSGDRLSQI